DWILKKQMHFTRLDAFIPKTTFSNELLLLYSKPKNLTKPEILQYLKKNEFYGHLQRTLKKVDLCSMANSLEVRVPYLDKNMISFSNSVIPQFTINHDRAKPILKDDLYQFIPIELVNKTK